MKAKMAHLKYEPLVDAILALSGGSYNVPINFETVAARFGGNKASKELGWQTFGGYVASASQENYIVQIPGSRNNTLLAAKSPLTSSKNADLKLQPIGSFLTKVWLLDVTIVILKPL